MKQQRLEKNIYIRIYVLMLWLCCTTHVSLWAASDASENAFIEAKSFLQSITSDPQKKKFRHNFDNAIKKFETIAAKYPKGTHADDALFAAAQTRIMLATASGDKKDLYDAQKTFAKLADAYPRSNLADDAHVLAAKCSADPIVKRRHLEAAIAHNGDQMRAARSMLQELPLPKGKKNTTVKTSHEPTSKSTSSLNTEATIISSQELKQTESTVSPVHEEEPPKMLTEADQDQIEMVTLSAVPSSKGQLPARKLMRIVQETSETIAIQFSAAVGVNQGVLPAGEAKPKRVFFDIFPAKMGQRNWAPLEVNKGFVQRIRAGQYQHDTVRVVMELTGEDIPEISLHTQQTSMMVHVNKKQTSPTTKALASVLSSEALSSDRTPKEKNIDGFPKSIEKIELKLEKNQETTSEKTVENSAPTITPNSSAGQMKTHLETGLQGGLSISQQLGLKIRRIVIDPGHGGNDTGAKSPKGILEKDITLAIAKRLRDRIKILLPDMEVALTREDDRTLSLQDRTNFATASAADLFISIHCNAHKKKKFRGVETYYLDVAHDQYAMRLAARENAELGEGSLSDLDYILADLAMKSNTGDSRRLAHIVQKNIIGGVHTQWKDIPNLGVKNALFYVLMGNKVPSILIETAFLSNPTEEKLLQTEAYQAAVADGVAKGIQVFIKERQALFAP